METTINNKCKAFTSLEQSRKLAEFLPLESADMCFVGISDNAILIPYLKAKESLLATFVKEDSLSPCWSLAALLEAMPKAITDEYDSKGCLGMSTLYNSSWGWIVYYTNDDVDTLALHEEQGNTLLEATYNMVCWLLENGYIKKKV